MAIRYFDRNGATAGFGTLTGTWDTTTASWSTSSAGNVATAAYTFTDADVAQFGATGTSAVAGTATIAVNVVLNGVTVQNLSALMTIAASGGSTLTMAGTSPTIDVQNTGSLRVTAPIAGNRGFTLAKTAGTGYELVELAASSNSVTTTNGPIDVASVLLVVDPGVASFNFASARDFRITGGWRLGDFTSAQTLAAGTTFAGTGCLELFGNSTNLVTLPAGALVGLNGTNDPATTYLTGNGLNATSGLALYLTSTTTAARNNFVDVSDLPYRLTYQSERSTATTITGRVRFIGPGATFANTQIVLLARGATSSTTATLKQQLFANQSDATPLIIGGGITRKGWAQAQTFELHGTSTADNAITGVIDDGGMLMSPLGISKLGVGKWVLSGANLYTGVTTIEDGTLAVAGATALGTTGAVTMSGTGQLMLQGGITVNKSQGTFTLHANNPIVSVGDNTLQTAGVVLGGDTTFEVTTGNKLTIANTEPINDALSSYGFTKTGAGELQLGDSANTYDGAVSVQAGTLTVTSLNNAGVAGVLGLGSSGLQLRATLRFAGSSAASTDRALALQGATPTLEATGTAAATYSGTITQTSEARQLVLKGTSTAANAFASALGDSSFATGIQKAGTGTWRATGALSYTGATDVDAGTLRVERPNGNTMVSAVTVDAGAFLELVTDTMASSGSTAGRVLGTGNVVVNGTVKTRGGNTQKGQVRYGGNLTFGAGSSLQIGAAA